MSRSVKLNVLVDPLRKKCFLLNLL